MPSSPGGRVTAATIFVVEDDPVMRGTLSKALEASGYHVRVAATGVDARALFGVGHPDLIILDLMLPDDDGLSLTASFRALTGAPILICSARQGQIDRVMAANLGAADFLAKPFELEELEARVKAVLHRSSDAEAQPLRDEIQLWRQHLRTRSRPSRSSTVESAHLFPTEDWWVRSRKGSQQLCEGVIHMTELHDALRSRNNDGTVAQCRGTENGMAPE